MAKLYSPNLRALDRIFRFGGSEISIDELDTTSKITTVLDVHRLAELAASRGNYAGYSNVSFVNTHAVVAGAIFSSFDPYLSTNQIMQGWPNPSDVWHWLIEGTARIAPSIVLTDAIMSINQGGVAGALTTHIRATHRWNGQATMFMDVANLAVPALSTTNSPVQVPLPALIPLNSTLRFASTASGAIADVIGQALIYTAPFGVLPPGLA